MKASLITHLNPTISAARLPVVQLESLSASQYNRRSWRRRLPAVLVASLLVAILLLAAGISLESTPLLVLVPLICLPLVAAVALSGA